MLSQVHYIHTFRTETGRQTQAFQKFFKEKVAKILPTSLFIMMLDKKLM